MPDWLSERKTLFSTKYPAFERNWKKRKAEEHINTSKAASSGNNGKDELTNEKRANKTGMGTADIQRTKDKLEKALEEIFQDDKNKAQATTSSRASVVASGKRLRKLPKR